MQTIYDLDILLRDYQKQARPTSGSLISLDGIDGCDAYNPSGALHHNGHTYHYARVEPRGDEFASWSVLFRQTCDTQWEMDSSLPRFHLQDPFVAVIRGEHVVGGVRILEKTGERVFFETVFLRGDSPSTLVEFARGPRNMKDLRLVALKDGKVGIFTRPLGGIGGRGRVGYTEVDDLDQIDADRIESADLLPKQPVESQWWGVNDACVLDDRRIGVIAHMAKFHGAERRYYAVAFVFDRQTRAIVRDPHIVADRSLFPHHPSKRQDLVDVVFPASFNPRSGLLLAGISDTTIGVVRIDDPFNNHHHPG
ncbi:MAG: DUF1861 family protein [Chloroflexota bacterium]